MINIESWFWNFIPINKNKRFWRSFEITLFSRQNNNNWMEKNKNNKHAFLAFIQTRILKN